MWQEFYDKQLAAEALKLDVLICNAGALMNQRTLSKEGVEVTFATHLLFGTYLLGTLAMPLLKTTEQSRLIMVSSGGMYNTKFPAWAVASSTGPDKYDGQFAYAYAKRGQVLLAEQWTEMYKDVKIVSCHPGWTLTEGVDAAYGEKKSYLEPLRTTWQGSEGIIWLSVAPTDQIQGGAFYLDRSPQVKHMAGPFFSEGSFTKNSRLEVMEMIDNLDRWSRGDRPTLEEIELNIAKKLPLQPMKGSIDIEGFMGDWHVLANIPTYPEIGAANGTEKYTWDAEKQAVRICFEFLPKGSKKTSEARMKGAVVNAPANTQWALDPKILGIHLPLGLTYLVLDLAEDKSYTIVGVPDRSYIWIMTREVPSVFEEDGKTAMEVYGLNTFTAPAAASTSSASAEPSRTDLMSVDISDKFTQEKHVLQKALKKAADLGYDPKKILRAPWTPPAEPPADTTK
jgi:dehydrogenase/reductase SDR family protein 12